MKIKLASEIEVKVPLEDLLALAYRAKQGEVLYHEKVAHEKKIVALRNELKRYQEVCEKRIAALGGADGQGGEGQTTSVQQQGEA